MLAPGLLVELHGLSRADLNGQRGFCLAFDTSKERWGVQLVADKTGDNLLNVRPANLQPVPPPSETEAASALQTAQEAAQVLRQARATRAKAARNKLVDDAAALLEAAEVQDPNCAMVHQLRGDMAHMVGDMARMVQQMRRAVANTRGSAAEVASRRLGLGLALGETGDEAGEEAECRLVLESHPGHIQAHLSLAQCLARGGRADDSIHEFMQALELPNDDPPLEEPLLLRLREAARSSLGKVLGERAQRQQRKADYQGAAASLGQLLEVPGLDADTRAKSEAHLATTRARLAQLPEALAAAKRGVQAATHEGYVGHPDSGVSKPTAAFAVHTLAGVKEAMGDAVATGARDPGTAATALYMEAKQLYTSAHQILKDPATRMSHGRVQAKAHPGLDWVSDDNLAPHSAGIHCGGVAKCVTQGATIEQLSA